MQAPPSSSRMSLEAAKYCLQMLQNEKPGPDITFIKNKLLPSLGAKRWEGQQLSTCPASTFSEDTYKHAKFQWETTDYATWLTMYGPAEHIQPLVRDRP